ncbi:MAG: FAD-dependent oxidoreductase [Chloroflexi bacterium]|nr:FAD-dependent oxidoreductase [Chloroflexota bacterium]
MAAELIVYGTSWCSDCKRAKRFLGEQQVKYRFVDVEADTAGRALVESHNDGKTIIPTIVFADGSVLVEPSNADLARKLGLPTEAKHRFYDVVVIGGGPAGLTAAFYAAREGLSVLVLERSSLGGQAALTERLDNYPGFPDGLSGSDFGKRLTEQSRRFGVEMVSAAEVSTIVAEEQGHLDHLVRTTDGSEYRAHAVLAAPGTTYRRLGAKGEADLIGAGIHYCATCDGPFYKGKELVVIGGGNSAAEEGQFLTQFASKVTLLVRGDRLSASKIYHDKVMNHPKMAVRFNTGVKEFIGTSRLEGLVIESGGREETLRPAAVFVFIGLRPNTKFLDGVVDLTSEGFIDAPDLRTSVKGVFAAGDARAGSTKQVASAVGEGAAAALQIRRYLEEIGEVRHIQTELMEAS